MNRESIRTEIGNFENIPLKERADFHVFLMKLMLGQKEKLEKETAQEWQDKKVNWALTYGKDISKIIDDPKNKNIKDLIIKKNFEEASIAVINKLENNK